MDEYLIMALGWLAMEQTCAGNLLIIYKRRSGFVIWIFGNIAWAVIALNVEPKLYSQVWNMAIYAVCNVLGLIEWSRKQEG